LLNFLNSPLLLQEKGPGVEVPCFSPGVEVPCFSPGVGVPCFSPGGGGVCNFPLPLGGGGQGVG